MTKNSPIVKDWFMLGFLTGAGGSVAKSLTNYALSKVFHMPTVMYSSVAASAVLGKRARVGARASEPTDTREWALGYVTDVLLGGMFGSALTYVYMKTPPGSETAKGVIGGVALWVATFGVGRQLRLSALQNATATEMANLLGVSALYGGIQGWFIGRYGAKLVDQSHPILTKEVTDAEFTEGRMQVEVPEKRERLTH